MKVLLKNNLEMFTNTNYLELNNPQFLIEFYSVFWVFLPPAGSDILRDRINV